MAKYGLIGTNISYSFSKTFFTLKFEKENRDDTYHNFDIQGIEELEDIIKKHPDLRGLNVTIPLKKTVLSKLAFINKEAQTIGAVNTIKIKSNGQLYGYNTDHFGFAKALTPLLPLKENTALILGTGGSSKAIAYVMETLGFDYKFVSRKKQNGVLTYNELNSDIIKKHLLIINCTPLGTFPNVHEFANIPYQYITNDHVLFDLIYNPKQTEFLKRGFMQGARVSNGLKMLEYQAEKSWSIWKS
ncbi:MAG: shikimate dehydrogenase [Candidatus Latescibacterota bacterium]|jgi:shikimate dehydrogenase